MKRQNKYYNAVSPQHHPAVHTFQTVTKKKKKKKPFQEVQKKQEISRIFQVKSTDQFCLHSTP